MSRGEDAARTSEGIKDALAMCREAKMGSHWNCGVCGQDNPGKYLECIHCGVSKQHLTKRIAEEARKVAREEIAAALSVLAEKSKLNQDLRDWLITIKETARQIRGERRRFPKRSEVQEVKVEDANAEAIADIMLAAKHFLKSYWSLSLTNCAETVFNSKTGESVCTVDQLEDG